MNRTLPLILSLLMILLVLPGCELIGDILAFGFWVGVIIVVIVVAIIWAIVRKLRGPGRRPVR